MVGGFNRDYSIADLRIMLADIFGEFDLRARRSKDQDFAGMVPSKGAAQIVLRRLAADYEAMLI
jgi:hypothetical protein